MGGQSSFSYRHIGGVLVNMKTELKWLLNKVLKLFLPGIGAGRPAKGKKIPGFPERRRRADRLCLRGKELERASFSRETRFLVPRGQNFSYKLRKFDMPNAFTVLHVEDDPNDVLLLQRAFKKSEFAADVHAVNDGDKAVAYLHGVAPFMDREKYPLPNLVLLDLKMPRKSGLEVLQWIRSQPGLRRLIVVVFTSSKHDDDINKAYDIGANSYLVKPVGFDALVHMVRTLKEYWAELNHRPIL
jgi:CheY-like chemotaxis protein